MVKATAEYGRVEYRLRMTGHATGRPDVCAACSALAGAFAGWCSASSKAWDVDIKEDTGNFLASAQGGQDLETALDTAVAGILRIEASYPDLVYVSVKKF